MPHSNQFHLLLERRFFPFFGAQALGAFNDNVYRNVLVILAAYQAAAYTKMDPLLLANVAGAVFILPFVLFSGIAGQLADRYDKALILKLVKACEILIMGIAALGFLTQSIEVLLAALFLMGTHSTFFAPAKYGLLPEVLRDSELVGGNAMLETGTFLAILLGTLAAGLLAAESNIGQIIAALLGIAAVGFAASLAIPARPPAASHLRIDWNPWTSTWSNVRAARESRTVFLSVLGISWFWFYGALILAQLPLYSKTELGGSEEVVTLLLVMFAAGVGIGSLLCERLSGRQVEIGLVPFGSLGLTIFAVDLYFATPRDPYGMALSAAVFIEQPQAWRILMDLALIGMFGGLFVVPLYAIVQQRARREAMSRIIGANNILNAMFMVAAAMLAALGLEAGLTIPQLILLTGILNAFVAAYIYGLLPEFLLRFIAWLLINFIYRLERSGTQNIPERGAALLICNHVSYADAIVISAGCQRPIRFIMESSIFGIPVLSTIFRGMKAIPVAPAKQEPLVYERAFEVVAKELRRGNLVCIFPEGRLTSDGEIAEFRAGMLRILKETPVPVIPMALSGLWDSMFSRKYRAVWQRWPRRFWPKIKMRVGAPIAPEVVTIERLRERVMELRGAER
jgi:1-acyl-sn-glycerol-3-phosphate acyltransferase